MRTLKSYLVLAALLSVVGCTNGGPFTVTRIEKPAQMVVGVREPEAPTYANWEEGMKASQPVTVALNNVPELKSSLSLRAGTALVRECVAGDTLKTQLEPASFPLPAPDKAKWRDLAERTFFYRGNSDNRLVTMLGNSPEANYLRQSYPGKLSFLLVTQNERVITSREVLDETYLVSDLNYGVQQFLRECGDRFVEQRALGYDSGLALRADFPSSKDRENFATHMAELSEPANLLEHLQSGADARKYSEHIHFTLSAFWGGGELERFHDKLGMGAQGYVQAHCDLRNLQFCLQLKAKVEQAFSEMKSESSEAISRPVYYESAKYAGLSFAPNIYEAPALLSALWDARREIFFQSLDVVAAQSFLERLLTGKTGMLDSDSLGIVKKDPLSFSTPLLSEMFLAGVRPAGIPNDAPASLQQNLVVGREFQRTFSFSTAGQALQLAIDATRALGNTIQTQLKASLEKEDGSLL